MLLIGVTGKKGSGKDTAADYISLRYGYRKIAFADQLKFLSSKYLGWNGKKDSYGRALLQFAGTEIARQKSDNIWVDFMRLNLSFLKASLNTDKFIISDVRFDNEANFIKEKASNGLLMEIRRDGEDVDAHKSESGISVKPDFIIFNNGNVRDLFAEIDEMFNFIVE
jgi:dephospho-CoA kinase